MDLLVFAHRGEAQEFIKRLALTATDSTSSFYKNDAGDVSLLITGEGIYEVFSKLGPILGKYAFSRVINLGVAGSLNNKFAPGTVINPRTVYCESEKLQFHSFSMESDSEIDIITSLERILSEEDAKRLSCFAPTVDRELWAIAKLCQETKTPLSSIKLISDMAGQATSCFDIKNRALEFSARLLEEFLKQEKLELEASEGQTPIPMSFTQKARYFKTLSSLELSDSFDKNTISIWLKELSSKGLAQKAMANALLDRMELSINPSKKLASDSFEKLCIPLSDIGAKAHFDKNFEKKKFTLQMEINNQANIENLQRALSKLDYSRFEKIWEGDFDV